ncbi:MAG TPA: phage portal protein [Sphingobium sp.]|uniref:phage portal protein n=1 Tax=Sphingobium sp. TaxID=1912891 RepID=UPI002ED3D662
MADSFFKRLGLGRRRKEPPRHTQQTPAFLQIGQQRPGQKMVWKATPRNLRYFSRTPYARRAINAIKNPIAMLDWKIVPIDGVKESPELARQAEVATYCLKNPNRDDSWNTMVEQVLEDLLIGAAAIEKKPSGDPLRPIWLWPVDGLSIQIFPGWTGNPDEARYAQSIGYGSYAGGGTSVQLRDDELIYIRPNPSTATPFGLGALEVAFNSIARQLGVGEFAGNVTSNSKPSVMIDLGKGADTNAVAAFRAYWTGEIEGQGKTPVIAADGAEVHKLFPDGDNALYLKYQEFLKSEIAIAFDLSPQNLGVERDVNRSTGEVSAERDWDQAIKPCALKVASHMTRDVLGRGLGFWQLQFVFEGLDREDEKRGAEVFAIEYENGAMTPDEYRETRGRPPLGTNYSKMTGLEFQIAVSAARGAASVLDPDLPEGKPAKNPPKE